LRAAELRFDRLLRQFVMSAIFRVTRRQFLRDIGVGTGALVLGCSMVPESVFAAERLRSILRSGIKLTEYVAITPRGDIIIFTHRSEMGQGIRSSLAAVLADEMEADWKRVTLRQADADAMSFGIPLFYGTTDASPEFAGTPMLIESENAQLTDASQSMALYYTPMRLFGAAIRLVMLRAAATRWGIDPAELEASEQKVWHRPTNRSIEYHWLLLRALKVPPPTTTEVKAALKPASQWRFIGRKMPFMDARDMVTGKAVYGADVETGRHGMLTAMIVRCPVANGSLKSFDASAALAVRGVKFVEPLLPRDFLGGTTGGVGANFIPHAGVAVLADNTWAASKGRAALKVEWNLSSAAATSNAAHDSDVYRGELEASTSHPGKPVRTKGDADAAFGRATNVVEASYYVPHLAQVPMEPPVAVALYENGRWEIWCPTQAPELTQHYVGLAMLEPDPVKWLVWHARELFEVGDCDKVTRGIFNEQLARLLGVDQPTLFKLRDELKKRIRGKVNVHVTLIGGSFGRKLSPDYAIEAAFLARQHPGVPIRVQWTREDDIQFGFYNAVSSQYLKAALDADGHPMSLLQRSAFTSFFATMFPPPNASIPAAVNDVFAKARAAWHNGGEYPYGSAIEFGQGLQDMPYSIDNVRIENCPAPSHLRVGCMRSGANIYHAFGIGSFADEMAAAAGRDSKDYLLDLIGKGHVLTGSTLAAEGAACFTNNLFPVDGIGTLIGDRIVEIVPGYPPDTRRLRSVVERVAKEARWDEKRGKLAKGRGLGIAAHRSRLSYVAMVMDVSINDAHELTIHEVHAAIDCGIVINPDRVRAQMEGGILYGLSLALLGEITVRNGSVVQHDFKDYPVLRIHQTPKKIFTYFMDTGEPVPPTGVGEPATPVVAPALANAIVAAGGPRIREIPFRKRVVVL
jgi:isoquinoline 1-oxidoreductase subunit beta